MTWHDEILRLKAILQPLLWRIPFALVILGVGFLLAVATRILLERILTRKARQDYAGTRSDAFFYPWIAQMVVLLATASLSLLALGVPGTVIGFLVSFSVALGLVADSFSGLRILMHKPFGIGDTIELKGDGFIGTVEQFSILGTVLITPERSRVFILNRQIFEHPIVNHSESNTRRLTLFEFVLEPPSSIEHPEELLQRIIQDFRSEESEVSGEVFLTRIDGPTVTFKLKLELAPWLRDKTASAFLQHAEAECKRHQIKIHSLALLKG